MNRFAIWLVDNRFIHRLACAIWGHDMRGWYEDRPYKPFGRCHFCGKIERMSDEEFEWRENDPHS